VQMKFGLKPRFYTKQSETRFYTRVQQLDLRFGVKLWCYGKIK